MVGRGQAMVGGMLPEYITPCLRFLAALSPDQRKQAKSKEGLAIGTLAPNLQALASAPCRGMVSPGELPNVRFQFSFAPAGSYVWHPVVKQVRLIVKPGDSQTIQDMAPLIAPMRAEALAEARRILPDTTPDQIVKSRGELYFAIMGLNRGPQYPGEPNRQQTLRLLAPLTTIKSD